MFGNLSPTRIKTAHGIFDIAVLPEIVPLGSKAGKPVSTFIEHYAMIPKAYDKVEATTLFLHAPNVVDDVFKYRVGKRYPIQSRILKQLGKGENGILLYIDSLSAFDRQMLTTNLDHVSIQEPANEETLIRHFSELLGWAPNVTLKPTRKRPLTHPDYPEPFSIKTDLRRPFLIQPFFETQKVDFPPLARDRIFPQAAELGAQHSFIKLLRHYAIIANHPMMPGQIPLVRVHSSCCTGDFNGSLQCECGPQLRKALKRVGEAGYGAVIYHDSEGRGIHSLAMKMELYKLHIAGEADTYDSMHQFGYPDDLRDYTSAVALLKKIGMPSVTLLTNNPTKVSRLEKAGLHIHDTRGIGIDLSTADAATQAYIKAKAEKGGHIYPVTKKEDAS